MVPGLLSSVTPWRNASPLRGRTCASYPEGSAMEKPAETSARPPGSIRRSSGTAAQRSAPAASSLMYVGIGRPSPSGKTRIGTIMLLLQKLREFRLERLHVSEGSVHAGVPDVRHLVQVLERFHDLLSHHGRRDFGLTARKQLPFDRGDDLFQLGFGDRPFLAGLAQADQKFLAVVLLAPSVFLDDEETRSLHTLVGREPVPAGETFAAPADNGLIVARINDPRLALLAARTDHDPTRLAVG